MRNWKILTARQILASLMVTAAGVAVLALGREIGSAVLVGLFGLQTLILLRSQIELRHLVARETRATPRCHTSAQLSPEFEQLLRRIPAPENTATLNKRGVVRLESALARIEAATSALLEQRSTVDVSESDRLTAALIQLTELQALNLRLLATGSPDSAAAVRDAQLLQWREEFFDVAKGSAIEFASSVTELADAGDLVVVQDSSAAALEVARQRWVLLAQAPLPCGLSLYMRAQAYELEASL